MIVYRQLFYCIIHVDQKTQKKVSKKTSTGSLCCSVEVERIESSISSISSSSSGYTLQPLMGSVDETDSSSYEGQSRVQSDAGFSIQLDFINQGGSLIEFFDTDNLAFASPSKHSSCASPSGPSSCASPSGPSSSASPSGPSSSHSPRPCK